MTTTISAVIDKLKSTTERDLLESEIITPLLEAEQKARKTCKYAVPEGSIDYLNRVGINYSPFTFENHNHPIHKNIEEHILQSLKHILITHCTLMFMKNQKAQRVRNYDSRDGLNYELSNYVITSKDVHRYGSFESQNIFIRDSINTPTVFIMDAIHYYDQAEIALFFKMNPNVHTIYATLFCPPELNDYNKNKSIFPDLYQLEHHDDGYFDYIPEKHDAGKYTQHTERTINWLKTFRYPGATQYNVHLLDSYYAQHLIMITRNKYLPDEHRSFHYPEYCPTPTLYKQKDIQLSQTFVPKKMLNEMYRYSYRNDRCTKNDLECMLNTLLKKEKMEISIDVTCHMVSTVHALKHVNHDPAYYSDVPLNLFQLFLSKWWYPIYNCTIAKLLDRPRLTLAHKLKNPTFTVNFSDICAENYKKLFANTKFRLNLEPDQFTLDLNNRMGELPLHIRNGITKNGQLIDFRHEELSREQINALRRTIVERIQWRMALGLVTSFDPIIRQIEFHLDENNIVRTYNFRQQREVDVFIDYPERRDLHALLDFLNVNIINFEQKFQLINLAADTANLSLEQLDKTADQIRNIKIERKMKEDDDIGSLNINRSRKPNKKKLSNPSSCSTAISTITQMSNPIVQNYINNSCNTSPTCSWNLSSPTLPAVNQNGARAGDINGNYATQYGNANPHNLAPIPIINFPNTYNAAMRAMRTNIPLPQTNTCLLRSVAAALGVTVQLVWDVLVSTLPHQQAIDISTRGPFLDAGNHGVLLAARLNFTLIITQGNGSRTTTNNVYNSRNGPRVGLNYNGVHFEYNRQYPGGEDFSPAALELNLSDLSQILQTPFSEHKPIRTRARIYIKDTLKGYTGMLKQMDTDRPKEQIISRLKARSNSKFATQNRTVKVLPIYGFGGSGKSRLYNLYASKYLHRDSPYKNGSKITIILPLNPLRAAVVEEMESDFGWCFKTFEVALVEKPNAIVILDDISKFPNGYTDALIVTWPHIQVILITGDILQAVHCESNPQSSLPSLNSEVEYFSNYVHIYLFYTWRLAQRVADRFGVVTYSLDNASDVHDGNMIGRAQTKIMPSLDAKNDATDSGFLAYTYAGSQGLTLNEVDFIRDEHTIHCDERSIFTALTRSKGNIYYVDLAPLWHNTNPLLQNFLANNGRQNRKHLLKIIEKKLPNAKIIEAPLQSFGGLTELPKKQATRNRLATIGASYGLIKSSEIMDYTKDKALWNPDFIKEMKKYVHPISVANYYLNNAHCYDKLLEDSKPIELKKMAKKPLTHFAIEKDETIQYSILSQVPPKESREYYHHKHGWTDQIRDDRPFQSCFLTHGNHDSATYHWSVEHRVRFVQEKQNLAKYNSEGAKTLGSILFTNYLKLMKFTRTEFDDSLFLTMVDENTKNRLQKPLCMLFNIRERGDSLWPEFFCQLFMKQQILKKLEKLYANAKAGQMIANLHECIILLMGPFCRYLKKQCDDQRPSNIYIHYRKNFDELRDFALKLDYSKLSLENDYTLYDQSQSEEFLNFQTLLMRYFNLPKFIIDYYVLYKTSLVSQHGPLDIMVFSGEPPTFQFNTEDNGAFASTQYIIPDGTPIMLAGDDSVINNVLEERPSFEKIKKKFKLVAKPNYTKYPIFCGWILTPKGIIKHPKLIYLRLKIAMEKGNLQDVIMSYAEESKYAYEMGEDLYEYLELEDIQIQKHLDLFFIQNKNKLSTKSGKFRT